MAQTLEELVVAISANTKNFDGKMKQSKTTFEKFSKAVKLGAIAAATGFGVFAAKSIQMASDAEEVQNKFNVVFGEMTNDAEEWADNFKRTTGRSREETKRLLADSQDLLTGFGASTDEAFKFSTQMQQLGVDLASFNNLQDPEAVEKLRKGLLGETENLKSLGIIVNETILKQEAMDQGYGDNLKSLTELEKIQLRYSIAVRQSRNAIGDAERSNLSFANQMKRLKATLADGTAEFGKKLLPAATKFLIFLNEVIPRIGEFKQKITDAITGALDPFITKIKLFADDIKLAFAAVAESDPAAGIQGILATLQANLEESEFGILRFAANASGGLYDFISFAKAELIPIIQKVRDVFIEVFPKIQEIVLNVLNRQSENLKAYVALFREKILPVIKDLVDYVVENLPIWSTIFFNAIDTVINIAFEFYSFIRDNVIKIIEMLVDFVVENIPLWKEIFINAFKLIIDIAITMYKFFQKNILPILQQLFDFVIEFFPIIGEVAGRIFKSIIDIATILWGIFKESLLPIIESIFQFIIKNFPTIKDTVINVFESIASIVEAAVSIFEEFLLPILKALWEFVEEFFPLIGATIQAAFDIVIGIVDGVIDTFEFLIGVIDRTIRKIKEFMTKKSSADLSGVGGGTLGISGIDLTGRALGGPVTKGKPYIKDENGAELFIPNENGRIVNTQASNRRTGENSGIGNISITNIFNTEQNPSEVVRKQKQSLVQQAKMWGLR